MAYLVPSPLSRWGFVHIGLLGSIPSLPMGLCPQRVIPTAAYLGLCPQRVIPTAAYLGLCPQTVIPTAAYLGLCPQRVIPTAAYLVPSPLSRWGFVHSGLHGSIPSLPIGLCPQRVIPTAAYLVPSPICPLCFVHIESYRQRPTWFHPLFVRYALSTSSHTDSSLLGSIPYLSVMLCPQRVIPTT